MNDTSRSATSTVIFVRTVTDVARLAVMLRLLGFPALPLHGQLAQTSRLGALAKFKSGARSIMVATDVAARGLDIPSVDMVVNYDLPSNTKDYIHRVGRTARAGRSGRSVTLVTQYDVELLQRIEAVIGTKLKDYGAPKDQVAVLQERVEEASREATREIREKGTGGAGGKRGRKRMGEDQDIGSEDEEGGGRSGGNGHRGKRRAGGGGSRGGGRGGKRR